MSSARAASRRAAWPSTSARCRRRRAPPAAECVDGRRHRSGDVRAVDSGATETTRRASAGLRRSNVAPSEAPDDVATDEVEDLDVAARRHRSGFPSVSRRWALAAVQSSHLVKSGVLPRCSSTAVIPAWQQAMSSLVCPADADAADHLAVDLDRPAADEDREPALVHVHDAEGLLTGLRVGVGVRRAAVAGRRERLVDGDLDARRLGVVGPLDDDRPAGGIADADHRADAELGRLGQRGVDGKFRLLQREAMDVIIRLASSDRRCRDVAMVRECATATS